MTTAPDAPWSVFDTDWSALCDPMFHPKEAGRRGEIRREGVRLADEHGERLTLALFEEGSPFRRRDVAAYFGSFGAFRMELGLKRHPALPETAATEEAIRRRFEELAAERGEGLTLRAFCEATGWNGRLVQQRCGSFGALRESAGLRRRPPAAVISEEALLDDVLRAWREASREADEDGLEEHGGRLPPGDFPTIAQYARLGRFSHPTLYKRLGGWAEVRDRVTLHALDGEPPAGE